MDNTTPTTTALAPTTTATTEVTLSQGCFGGQSVFELAQREAKALIASNIMPDTYKGNMGNMLIVLDMAGRLKASPVMVAQNLYLVHGKPAWSSQFLIACVNQCGKFSPLRYKMTGKKGTDSYGCIAWAKDLNDGEVLESPEVTMGMASAEGWVGKSGSKWKTMPELMLRYRCATLFARLYAPELTMGLPMSDEVIDTAPIVTEARKSRFEQDVTIPQEETATATIDAEVAQADFVLERGDAE